METIEVKWPDAIAYLERLEHSIDLCRKRLIKALAKEYDISTEKATELADEISKQAEDELVLPNRPFKVEY